MRSRRSTAVIADLRFIARALGGTVVGRQVLAPGPGHSPQDRSLSLWLDPTKSEGISVHSHAGDDWRECKAYACKRLGIERNRPRHDHRIKPQRPIAYFPTDPVEPDQRAIELWRSAVPIEGTLAEQYLRHRGITLAIPPTLRFIPELEYMPRVSLPAMVAAVQRSDRRVIAVQLTFLHPSGARKAHVANPRKTFGALGAGAVRLGPAGPVIGLAEGTESALSAMQLFGGTVWATLGAQRLGSIRLPSEVDKVILYPDRDETGNAAAHKAAEAYRLLRYVECKFPTEGCNDFNDELAAEIGNIAQ
jgi:putative DNA primase/helicase